MFTIRAEVRDRAIVDEPYCLAALQKALRCRDKGRAHGRDVILAIGYEGRRISDSMFDSHIDVLRHIERKSDEAIMQSVTKSLPNILDKYRQDHDEDVPYKTTTGFIKSFGKKKRKRPAPKIPLIDLVDTKDILSRMTVSEKIVLGLNLIFRPSAY